MIALNRDLQIDGAKLRRIDLKLGAAPIVIDREGHAVRHPLGEFRAIHRSVHAERRGGVESLEEDAVPALSCWSAAAPLPPVPPRPAPGSVGIAVRMRPAIAR